jgi:hypothetical protein
MNSAEGATRLLRRRRINKTARAIRASKIVPPRTPPAITPAFFWDDNCCEDITAAEELGEVVEEMLVTKVACDDEVNGDAGELEVETGEDSVASTWRYTYNATIYNT